MLSESLQRVAECCRALVEARPDLVCCEGKETVSIARPQDGLWIEIEQAPRVGLPERIVLTEYRVKARQVLYASSAWEAITTITQRLEPKRR
jgi:hypothetical protein